MGASSKLAKDLDKLGWIKHIDIDDRNAPITTIRKVVTENSKISAKNQKTFNRLIALLKRYATDVG